MLWFTITWWWYVNIYIYFNANIHMFTNIHRNLHMHIYTIYTCMYIYIEISSRHPPFSSYSLVVNCTRGEFAKPRNVTHEESFYTPSIAIFFLTFFFLCFLFFPFSLFCLMHGCCQKMWKWNEMEMEWFFWWIWVNISRGCFLTHRS